jgi:ABC-type multidrug transport system ATPase subunit
VIEAVDLQTERLAALQLSVTFSLPQARTICVIGPSGAGKTTFLRGLLGLDRFIRGQARVCGESLDFNSNLAPAANVSWLSANVRGCMQQVGLWPHMSVRENLEMTWGAGALTNGSSPMALLDQIGAAHTIDRKPVQLSGGEKKRIGLVRMLACKAKLYCLDEIDSGLDNARKKDLARIVMQFSAETPFVLITHDPEFADLLDGAVLDWASATRRA